MSESPDRRDSTFRELPFRKQSTDNLLPKFVEVLNFVPLPSGYSDLHRNDGSVSFFNNEALIIKPSFYKYLIIIFKTRIEMKT